MIYCLLLGLAQRTLPISSLPGILLEASKVTGIIMLLIGVSGILGWVLAFARLPQLVSDSLLGLTDKLGGIDLWTIAMRPEMTFAFGNDMRGAVQAIIGQCELRSLKTARARVALPSSSAKR